jgi:hypothetical protein
MRTLASEPYLFVRPKGQIESALPPFPDEIRWSVGPALHWWPNRAGGPVRPLANLLHGWTLLPHVARVPFAEQAPDRPANAHGRPTRSTMRCREESKQRLVPFDAHSRRANYCAHRYLFFPRWNELN